MSARRCTRVPWLATISAVWLAVAAVAGAEEAPPAEIRELLGRYQRELQQALRSGLARGPVAAIGACRLRAPEIAEDLSRDGVRVGRTSQRLRNPANAAPSWVEPLLAAYLENPEERAPKAVSLAPGRAGYVEPIGTQPLCLGCHGASLAPELSARISELYPEDRAVGFEVGDLRGLFWIEYPVGGD